MVDVSGFIRKASEKCGYLRESYDESRMPTDINKVTIVPFFGDLRSTFVLSSILLKRFKEEEKSSRYIILASWPGFSDLFPYVDEYWGLQDLSLAKKLYGDSSQMRNKHSQVATTYRSLNQYFFEDMMIPHEYFVNYYGKGLRDGFWAKYKKFMRFLPNVPSAATLGKDFNRELALRGGFKVFVFPSTHLKNWHLGDVTNIPVSKTFWISFVNFLLANRFVPVVYKSFMTHDLSSDLMGKCIFSDEADIGKVMATMRSTGCVLDIFSGISKLSIAARCPFLAVDERSKYVALREREIDDLCGINLPKQYIFSFPTIIEGGTIETWNDNIFQIIVSRLNSFLPDLDRDTWPSTGESFEQVPYEKIRKYKTKKFGTRFLKIPNE